MGNIGVFGLQPNHTTLADSLDGFEAVPHHRVGSGGRGGRDEIGALRRKEQNGGKGFLYLEQELTRQTGKNTRN